MSNEVYIRLLNLALRGLSMGSKLVLVAVLAKYLSPEDVGLYGLITATIAFSLIAVGGEYYTYSQRELLTLTRDKWPGVIQHQILAALFLYVILLPAQYLVFYFELIPSKFILIFFILLIAEHIAQEINRLIVVMQKQLLASIVLFIRLGAWVWAAVLLFIIDESFQTLNLILYSWLCGTLLAICLGIYLVRRELPNFSLVKIDYRWLMKGYKVGAIFLISTLCIRAIMTIDRYAIEFIGGKDFLGVYVVYASIAMAINSVLVPTVFSFLYPQLIESYRKAEFARYNKTLREMTISVISVGFIVGVSIGAIAPYIFEWIDKPIYLEHITILWLLLLMSFTYCVSLIPHYMLYAKGDDRGIMLTNLTALILFVVFLFVYSKIYDTTSEVVVICLISAFIWMTISKLILYQFKDGKHPEPLKVIS